MYNLNKITQSSDEYKIYERNISIDIIKTIAIFLIIMSHVLPLGYIKSGGEYIDLTHASLNPVNFILQFTRYLGNIGNALFIISSAWLLVDKNKVKYKKIIIMLLDYLIISLIFLTIFILNKYNMSKSIILKQLAPSFFNLNWFIQCYAIFYMITPMLYIVKNNINKKQEEKFIKFFSIFIIWMFIRRDTRLYCDLIGFVYVYYVVDYIKKYRMQLIEDKRKNSIIFIASILLLVLFSFLVNFSGLKIGKLEDKALNFITFINPFIMIVSFSTFLLIYNKNIKINKFNKIFTYISSLSLYIYVIHENDLIRNYARGDYFKFLYNNFNYNYIVLLCFISSIITFIVSVIIATIYKNTLHKGVVFITNKIYDEIKFKGEK